MVDMSERAIAQRMFSLEVTNQLKSLIQQIRGPVYTPDTYLFTHDRDAGVVRFELILRLSDLLVDGDWETANEPATTEAPQAEG